MAAPSRHVPRPLQVLAGIMLPPAQLESLQTVPAAYFEQPPCPLQSPDRPQVSCFSATHWPCTSGLPSATGWHSPILPGWLQLTQAPVQARLQQTPSAQKPESHSVVSLQVAPSGFCPQLPATQSRPSHWALPSHLVKQRWVVESQENGEQTTLGPAWHTPPSHTLAPTTVLPSQRPSTQMLPSGYLRQLPL